MKKLLLTVAITAMILTAEEMNAQVTAEDQTAQEQTAQKEYMEIQLTEVPAAVTEAVKTDFGGAVIGKAYINGKKQYKLVLEIDGIEKTVYANEAGEWIKPKK